MRIRLLSLLFVSCICVIVCHAQEKPSWLWHCNFEMTRDYLEGLFHVSGNPNSHVVHEPAVSAGGIVRMDLDRRTDPVPYRTELYLKGLPASYFDEGNLSHFNEDYWYALRVYLPADWQMDSYPEIIIQWNSKPDEGEKWRYPPAAVRIESGKAGIGRNYVMYVFADARTITAPADNVDLYSYHDHFDLGDIAGDLGKWTDWIFQIKWSYEGRGYIRIWKDGVKIFDKEPMSNAYHDPSGPFFKFGIYKWNWNPEERVIAPPGTVSRRTIYFDDLRLGAGRLRLNDLLAVDQPTQ